MLKIYPRGFVGPILQNKDNGQPEIKQELNIANNTYRLDTSIKKMEITPDSVIEELFTQYRKDPSVLMKFDFRERLLKRAKILLSLDNQAMWFKNFIEAQFSSPKLSFNHVDILKELLAFISESKVGFKMVTWERILENQNQLSIVPDDKKQALYKVLLEYDVCKTHVPLAVLDWVKQKNGYSHLLRSLWLLFGNLDVDHQ